MRQQDQKRSKIRFRYGIYIWHRRNQPHSNFAALRQQRGGATLLLLVVELELDDG